MGQETISWTQLGSLFVTLHIKDYSEPGDLCCTRAEDQLIGTPNSTSSESDCQS